METKLSRSTQWSLLAFCVGVGIGSLPVPLGGVSNIGLFLNYISFKPILFLVFLAISIVLGVPKLFKEKITFFWFIPSLLPFVSLLNVAIFSANTELIAIPSDQPKIGILLDEDYANSTVFISGVNVDSPAESAGLQRGDVIYQINGETIGGSGLYSVHEKIDASDNPVDITIFRSGKRFDFEITKE